MGNQSKIAATADAAEPVVSGKAGIPDATAIWEALGKTDPRHTKGFNRAGGFKGTALKPMWAIKRLTEQFGPVGKGWGYDKPTFQVVEAGGEVLVYSIVGAWIGAHTDSQCEPVRFYGVGGDKVLTKRKSGDPFMDDEAFKKAFTDALMNAFKHLGVGADIHMGQFDDSKYVQNLQDEIERAEQEANQPAKRGLDGPITSKADLYKAFTALQTDVTRCGDDDTLDALMATDETKAIVEQCERDAPHYLHGGDPAPPEFEGLFDRIKRMRDEFLLENVE